MRGFARMTRPPNGYQGGIGNEESLTMRMLCGAIRVVGLEMLGVSLVLWAIFAVAGVAGESVGLTAPRPLHHFRTLLFLRPVPISSTHLRMMSVSEDEPAVSLSDAKSHTGGRRTLSQADNSR